MRLVPAPAWCHCWNLIRSRGYLACPAFWTDTGLIQVGAHGLVLTSTGGRSGYEAYVASSRQTEGSCVTADTPAETAPTRNSQSPAETEDAEALVRASGLEPIERTNLVEEVTERITKYIVNGGLSAGDRVPTERELSARFRVGRSTIREAIKALRVLGVVETAGRRIVVGGGRPEGLGKSLAWRILMSDRTASQAIEARRVLEVALARMAAERATDEEIAGIGRLLEVMRTAPELAAYLEADWRFHAAIARAAGNDVLLVVTATLQQLERVWMQTNLDVDRESVTSSFAEDEAIQRALWARDPIAAGQAMDSHLRASGERLLSSVPGRVEG